ncbi:MAG: cupin domain-containing protein [Bdellovibrionia bacterium]
MNLTADAIRNILGLKPHTTCGYVNETFRSSLFVPAAQLPPAFMGSRAMGTVLYFMVTQDAPIQLHRIRSDQMYHHYLGDPLEVLLLYPKGDGEVLTVGPDLVSGMRPQLLIPGGTFHISRLRRPSHDTPGVGYALLGTTEWPGADHSDVELGIPEKLMELYPHMRHSIAEFTGRMKEHRDSHSDRDSSRVA